MPVQMNRPGTFEVTGLAELDRALLQMGTRVSRSVVGKALRASAKPVVKEARRLLKINRTEQSGLLRKSIGVKLKKYKLTGTQLIVIGPRAGKGGSYRGRPRDPVKYAHFIELGVPGRVRAWSFLAKALDIHEREIVTLFLAHVEKGIQAEAKKLAQKATAKA